MNPLHKHLVTGTIGELLVQLRLLQYGVQAAPPLKDTGNDLIAVRGNIFRAVQIKTIGGTRFDLRGLPNLYHLLACVRLVGEGHELFLDRCEIYLVLKDEVRGLATISIHDLRGREINQNLIDRLFA